MPGIRSCCSFSIFLMPWVESDFHPLKFNSWRGRCEDSEKLFTNQSVSGPVFYQLLLQDVNLRKQSIEFLQFWD